MVERVEDAVRATEQGTIIRVKVKTGCRSSVFPAGYDPWRRAVEIHVRARPRGGQANREIINMVRDFFDVGTHQVAIVSGATSPEKSIWVARHPTEVVTRINHEL